MKERRFEFKNRPSGYIGSILIGMAFAAGWTPCTGPILMSVILLAGTNPDSAMLIYDGLYIRICDSILSSFIFCRKNELDSET